MAKWSANLKATFDRAFPERQIYHRSGGTVRYISISPWQQAICALGATALAGWTIFLTGTFALGGSTGTLTGSSDDRELAKYERWVQELRAKDALSRSLLEERTDAFQRETAEWEDRQKALEDLFEQLKGDETLDVSALTGDGADLLVRASIEEADDRQSRDSFRMTATLDTRGNRVSVKNLKYNQERMLDEAEDLAIERAERARSVIQLTTIGSDRIMESAEMGGPLVSMANLTAGGETLSAQDASFYNRLTETQARVAEMQYYEQIVESLPLGAPVGVPFRYTSPYGIRVDPFIKRPRWHNGIDVAAYGGAPIVASGPGTVSFAGARSGYGRVVEVDHGYGFKSRYGHLRSITVSKGDTVEVGDLVGKMGTTGRSTGYHLHFEVFFNGKAYDPVKFLKAGRHVHEE
ncbi:peptidoglycan DD-metalloendopeptidase family protein [Hyphomonas sp. UBA4494]|jgi:murein DD-endopeptidase MepM/ murein hydrolase activator NlpD|uniref:peptidoglycan DD-metalloendopeptidase family protein n=1 Tax=Hyphomonas sp. UBA4494 TaxID=1946631 RepID=UPI0025BBF453|nr:peptidoglycan DD-metalloendopeptidase family protein [Hyphomonas sp. UBA4494]